MIITCDWISFSKNIGALRICACGCWGREPFSEKSEIEIPASTQRHRLSIKSTELKRYDLTFWLYLTSRNVSGPQKE